ncbi:hypothetical protein HK101_009648 [Irineochytrium annulatum]|nr:hypothetical protein HK101_009648 [Irineochytrium annulatum]
MRRRRSKATHLTPPAGAARADHAAKELLPNLPVEIVRLIVHSLDPDDVLDRRCLVTCHQVSTTFLLDACAVLWPTAELDLEGRIRRRLWEGSGEGTELRRTVAVDQVVLALRHDVGSGGYTVGTRDDVPSGFGRVSWRWGAYLRSVGKLAFRVPPKRGLDNRVDASLLGPWLGRFDEVELNTYVGPGVNDDEWVIWLRDRWAAGNVPRTVKLLKAPFDLARDLASHRLVRHLSVGMVLGGGETLRELLKSVKHGLGSLQLGSGLVDGRQKPPYPMDEPNAMLGLHEYAREYAKELRGVNLSVDGLEDAIPSDIPVICLDLHAPFTDIAVTKISDLRGTLKTLLIHHYVGPEVLLNNALAELNNLEVFTTGLDVKIENCTAFVNTLVEIKSLRSLTMDYVKDFKTLVVCFRRLSQLESLDLMIPTRRKINFDELLEGLPKLTSLTLAVMRFGKATVGLRTSLKLLKLTNVRLVVDRTKLATTGMPFLEKLSVEGASPQIVHLGRRDFKKQFEKQIGDSAVAPRLRRVRVSEVPECVVNMLRLLQDIQDLQDLLD